MKTYRVMWLLKVVMLFFCLILFILSLYGIIHGENSFMNAVFGIVIAIFSPICALLFVTLNVKIYHDKIVVKSLPLIPARVLEWKDVAEIKSEYFLFPEAGTIHLMPIPGTGKKPIGFTISGMPIELIRDILANVPKDAKVHLYPYLKRRAEGKQIIYYNK